VLPSMITHYSSMRTHRQYRASRAKRGSSKHFSHACSVKLCVQRLQLSCKVLQSAADSFTRLTFSMQAAMQGFAFLSFEQSYC
jgi:hypothetical protein